MSKQSALTTYHIMPVYIHMLSRKVSLNGEQLETLTHATVKNPVIVQWSVIEDKAYTALNNGETVDLNSDIINFEKRTDINPWIEKYLINPIHGTDKHGRETISF